MGGIINELGNYKFQSLESFLKDSFWREYYVKFPTMYVVAFAIIFPLCLLKNISKMRFNSIFGIGSLILLIFIIVVQTPWYIDDYWTNVYREDDPKTHINIWNISVGFDEHLSFFKGTATLFYAYTCHIGAFPIYKELKNNNLRRIRKVFRRSLIFDALIYLIVGLAGYLSVPVNTPELIIERYRLFDSDMVMTFGWIFFIFTLLMKIPAKYNSFRITFIGLLGYDPSVISNKT
jgi:amino acid permease